ncbi:hypothetical protein N9L03_04165, partial [Alphaproteobacteria bacterium]|nr:hypothetical protein [Alphaproteobacteria bacterium]
MKLCTLLITQELCINENINFKEYDVYIAQAFESCKEFVRHHHDGLATIENNLADMIAGFHMRLG